MTNETRLLPLFTLPLVACPYEVIPLHIFEPRYRELMSVLLAEQEAGRPGEFVIALSRGGDHPASIATVVRLSQVIKRHEDGQLDVLVLGRRRCRIKQIHTTKAYLTVDVERWEDARADWEEALATEAFRLHQRLILTVSGQDPNPTWYAGRSNPSFFLAANAGLSMAVRQVVLEMQDENQRLRHLIQQMQLLLKQLVSVQAACQSITQSLHLQQMIGSGGPPA